MGRIKISPDPTEFGDLLLPGEAIEPILAKPVRNALLEWLTEVWAEKELEAVGIQSRKRAIFDGAPGVGKTTLAHHLAARLGLPMLAVRPERLIDRWLGSTGQNIGKMFDAVAGAGEPIVLFIDEFDTLGQKRTQATQGVEQEANNFVNTLLQCMDRYEGFLIAATNFSDRVDGAVWRRFDIHITLEVPGQFEREQILKRYLAPFGLRRDELREMAEAFATASPALMRHFCENLKRQIVIGPKVDWDMTKNAVVERLLTTVKPHPDLGLPRLWSHMSDDLAVRNMTWPLQKAADIVEGEPAKTDGDTENVIPMHKGGAK